MKIPKLFVTCILFTVCLYCGCSKKENAIRFMMWGGPEELETVKEYIVKFNEKHPDIKVSIIHTQPSDFFDSIIALYLNKKSPDVFYVSREYFGSYLQKKMLLDLTPFVEKDREFNVGDFYPEILNSFKSGGKLYGLGKDFATLVLYYNKDMFDRAGVKYPDGKWTWNDFLAACKKLTKDEDGDGRPDRYGFVMESWFGEVCPWIWQNGGKIMEDGKCVIGTKENIEKNSQAVQFMLDLVWKHKVAQPPEVTRTIGTLSLFFSGRAAMCTYGRWACMNFRNIKDFRWDTSVLPYNKKRATTLFTVAYGISSQSERKEDAWKLVRFLTETEIQIDVAKSGQAIPVRMPVAQSHHFLKSKSLPEGLNHMANLESIQYAFFPPSPPEWPEMSKALDEEFEPMFSENRPAEKTLLTLQKRMDTIFK